MRCWRSLHCFLSFLALELLGSKTHISPFSLAVHFGLLLLNEALCMVVASVFMVYEIRFVAHFFFCFPLIYWSSGVVHDTAEWI